VEELYSLVIEKYQDIELNNKTFFLKVFKLNLKTFILELKALKKEINEDIFQEVKERLMKIYIEIFHTLI
jgi:hypothetical protein